MVNCYNPTMLILNMALWALLWLVANMAGFFVGSVLGATDGGAIPAFMTGVWERPGLIVGDLVFGACIGLAQWLALRLMLWRNLSPYWVVLTAFGFLVGARLGPIISFRVTSLAAFLPIVFGIVMGTAQGVATWLLLRRRVALAGRWIIVVALAWIVGEVIAFSLAFNHLGTPLVGGAVAVVTGLFLATLRRPTELAEPAEPQATPN